MFRGDKSQLDDGNTAPSPSSEHALLLAQIRELYGRVAYTHKTHEKQADICSELHQKQRRIKVVLTAVSSGAFLASLSGLLLDEQWGAVVTSFIAVLVTGSSLADTTFKHGEETQQHRETAANLWGLRESYLSLIVDLKSASISVEQGRLCRDRLQAAAEKILKDAPRTTAKAYSRAQKALKFSEDLTFAESEIDQLLPVQLRNRVEVRDVSSQ
jgi:hypothetical protein